MEPIRYMTSLLTFYLKGEIKSEQNFIVFKNPNTILGLIPLGAKTDKYPVTQIASTSTNFKLKLGKLILGIIVAIAALSAMKDSFAGALFILLFAANWIIDAFEIDLVVTTTAGQQKPIDFFIFEKAKAQLAEQQINEMISNRLSDTNVREQTNRVVDAINNKWISITTSQFQNRLTTMPVGFELQEMSIKENRIWRSQGPAR